MPTRLLVGALYRDEATLRACRHLGDRLGISLPGAEAPTRDAELTDSGRVQVGCASIPVVGLSDPVLKANLRAPTESSQFRGVEEFARRAVGLLPIEDPASLETDINVHTPGWLFLTEAEAFAGASYQSFADSLKIVVPSSDR